MSVQKIRPFLWFDGKAEEAARFYVSLFKDSKLLGVMGARSDGPAMGVEFELEGRQYVAFNGGPDFKFTEAISLAVDCKSQKEIDSLWEKLTADGGQESRCGWLKDKYGLSWQIIPTVLIGMLTNKDREKAGRATQAMLSMKKLDIAELQKAYDGK